MGVTKLWELVAPCGRRCSVDALARKKLAVDASIWLIQFIKAMRDESGEMVQNAPLLGLFRRLCKLLFLHVQPVLVFDGATPVLKQRTVARRQAFRARQEGSLKRTAEKILLNQLKGKHLLHGLHGDTSTTAASRGGCTTSTSSVVDETAANAAIHAQFGDEDHAQFGSVPKDCADSDKEEAAASGWGDYPSYSDGGAGHASLSDFAEAAAAKGGVSAELNVSGAARLALGSIVVPRAADLDTEAIRHLPPAMQFELLDEIKINERNRRRDQLIREEHTAESFSHQQLHNYIEVSKVAGQVSKLRSELSEAANSTRRIAGDHTKEYVLTNMDAGESSADSAAENESDTTGVLVTDGTDWKKSTRTSRPLSQGIDACGDADMARAVALSMEDAAAMRRRAGKRSINASESVRQQSESADGHEGKKGERQEREGREVSELVAAKAMSLSVFGRENGCISNDSAGGGESSGRGRNGSDCSASGHSVSCNCAGGSLGSGDGPWSSASSVHVRGSSTYGNSRPRGHAHNEHACCSEVSVTDLMDSRLAPPGAADHLHAALTVGSCCNRSEAGTGDAQLSNNEEVDDDLEISFDLGDASEDEADDEIFPASFFKTAQQPQDGEGVPGDSMVITLDSDGESGAGSPTGSLITARGPQASTIGSPVNPSSVAVGSQELRSVHTKASSIEQDSSSAWRMNAKKRLWAATKITAETSVGQSAGDAIIATSVSAFVGDASSSRNGCCGSESVDTLGGEEGARLSSELLSREGVDGETTVYMRHPAAAGVSEVAEVPAAALRRIEHVQAGLRDAQGAAGRPRAESVSEAQRVRLVAGREGGGAGSEGEVDSEPPIRQGNSPGQAQLSDSPEADVASESGTRGLSFVEPRSLASALSDTAVGFDAAPSTTGSSSDINRAVGAVQSVSQGSEGQGRAVQDRSSRYPAMSEAEQEKLRQSLSLEAAALYEEQRKQKRDASSLTADMYEESKQLLALFGIPFIVAPAEAEAQCAHLEMAGLVDGVVTEDNDTFLFGGRHVYKHLFDANRHVETYHMTDIEAEVGLDRRKLVDMALLLGSDYTDGVHGVGIVNAMEVVSVFQEPVGGLAAFGAWARSWSRDGPEATEGDSERMRTFKRKHQTLRRSWELGDGFPSMQVCCLHMLSPPGISSTGHPCRI